MTAAGGTPTPRSSSSTPRTTAGWSGSSVLLVRDLETAEEVVQDSFVAMHGSWRTAARARPGPGLPPADGGEPVPVRAAAPRRAGEVRRRRAGRRTRPARCRRGRRGRGAPARAVLDAMRTLPDRQREVLALRYYLDLSEAEIASTLGISRGAVKSHASRGVAALRTLMEDAS